MEILQADAIGWQIPDIIKHGARPYRRVDHGELNTLLIVGLSRQLQLMNSGSDRGPSPGTSASRKLCQESVYLLDVINRECFLSMNVCASYIYIDVCHESVWSG